VSGGGGGGDGDGWRDSDRHATTVISGAWRASGVDRARGAVARRPIRRSSKPPAQARRI